MRKYRFHMFAFIIAMFLVGSPTYAQTISTTSPTQDTQTIIKLLQGQIKVLETQITQLKAQLELTNQQVTAIQMELKINRSLQRGVTGDDVKGLQTFLSQFPDIYPERLVTGYFGPLTEAAIKRFQTKNSLESIGIVGPKTLFKLNELITKGAGASGIVPPGLLTAPGIQKRIEVSTTTTPSAATTTTSTATITPSITPSGTIPAISATPATPAITTATISTIPTSTTTATTTTTSCTESWTCYDWSLCSNSTQTRTCVDNNNCGTTNNRPALSQSCIAPTYSLTLLSPNGGEAWTRGQTYTIGWQLTGLPGYTGSVDIYLLPNSAAGQSNQLIAWQVPISAGSYQWSIPVSLGSYVDENAINHYVEILLDPCPVEDIEWKCREPAGAGRDKSDAPFTIAAPSITTSADSGNSTVTVQKVGVASGDFIKYSFNLSDPDGIAEFEIKPATNSFVQARNYRDGTQPYPSCPVGPVEMGQFTLSLSLDQASWPFHGWVLDCAHNIKYTIEIPAPPTTSLIEQKNMLASIITSVSAISSLLKTLLESLHLSP